MTVTSFTNDTGEFDVSATVFLRDDGTPLVRALVKVTCIKKTFMCI